LITLFGVIIKIKLAENLKFIMIYKVRPKAVKTEAIHWLGNTTDFSNLNELLGDRPDYLKKYSSDKFTGPRSYDNSWSVRFMEV